MSTNAVNKAETAGKAEKAKYDVVVGLEIHAELNTKTKGFCGCPNEFGSDPNTNCCPICAGLPGALPDLNRAAVAKTITAGLALGCRINETAIFERKNYFYPDLSGAYQKSQLEKPICIGGGITLKSGKFIRLNRIHLEEDAGKLIHDEVSRKTRVDYNRCGVALIEMVTEPDLSSAAEVVEFLEEVRSRLTFADVANCKMEEGGMRCDINISLKPAGAKKLGNRIEMKNLNSFKMAARAVEYETVRQTQMLDEGKTIAVETRKWNEASGKTTAMRAKDGVADYRYFRDPDIYAIDISAADVEKIKSKMPVLAYQLKERFVTEFGLPEYDAGILTKTKATADFYLACLALFNEPKKISNWVMVDLGCIMNEKGFENIPVSAKDLVEIIKMVESKAITKTVGLQLLNEVISAKKSPAVLAKELGLLQGIDDKQILEILNKLKSENARVAEDFKTRPEKVLPFIIGYVMKNTAGKAKSESVQKLIEKVFN